jgi:hypothetical protein
MNDESLPNDEPLDEQLRRVDRRIRRDELLKQITELGGLVGGPEREDVSDAELSFLEHVLAWETGPRSPHRDWVARHGQTFMPPAELAGRHLKTELWRLIRALAHARVFFYHTNHLNDAELYARLWTEVLPGECPDGVRTPDDACHWDFADPSSDGEEVWLRFYASPAERQEWSHDFPQTPVPPRCRAPHRRDHRLPVRN